MALNEDYSLSILPDSNSAVDTITIDGTAYVNDGRGLPPENSSWTTVNILDVTSNHTITVSFSATSDTTGVPDKYKLRIQAISSGNGSVSPSEQLIVYGSDAIININPDEGYAVDTIDDGTNIYVNDGK